MTHRSFCKNPPGQFPTSFTPSSSSIHFLQLSYSVLPPRRRRPPVSFHPSHPPLPHRPGFPCAALPSPTSSQAFLFLSCVFLLHIELKNRFSPFRQRICSGGEMEFVLLLLLSVATTPACCCWGCAHWRRRRPGDAIAVGGPEQRTRLPWAEAPDSAPACSCCCLRSSLALADGRGWRGPVCGDADN
jgi:hypothetical protein